MLSESTPERGRMAKVDGGERKMSQVLKREHNGHTVKLQGAKPISNCAIKTRITLAIYGRFRASHQRIQN